MTEAMKPLKSAAGSAVAVAAATEVASLMRIWTMSKKSRKLASRTKKVESGSHERKAAVEKRVLSSKRRG